MNVSQLMTRDVLTCRTDEPVSHAAQVMWDHDCGCVPVVDDTGTIRGMITDRDICMAALTQGRTLDQISIASAMSRQVHATSPNADVEHVARLMSSKKVRRIPVVDGQNRIIGLLSLGDFARSLSGKADTAISAPTVARTLSEISMAAV
jgi:CBS domain-containing protein